MNLSDLLNSYCSTIKLLLVKHRDDIMNNPAKVVQGFMKDKFNIHDDIILSLGYLLKVVGMNDAFENRCNIKHITGTGGNKRTLTLNKDSKISNEFISYALRFEKSYNKHRLNDVSAKKQYY